MKIAIICASIFILALSHSLEHCINHILHQSQNEDFECQDSQELHFYSTYVLPDGAYRCLEEMKNKQGFYVSTVKDFKHLIIRESEVNQGIVIREDMRFTGWKCDKNGLINQANFKGLKLFLSKCKHNQANFEDICIIKGWPLQEIPPEDIL